MNKSNVICFLLVVIFVITGISGCSSPPYRTGNGKIPFYIEEIRKDGTITVIEGLSLDRFYADESVTLDEAAEEAKQSDIEKSKIYAGKETHVFDGSSREVTDVSMLKEGAVIYAYIVNPNNNNYFSFDGTGVVISVNNGDKAALMKDNVTTSEWNENGQRLSVWDVDISPGHIRDLEGGQFSAESLQVFLEEHAPLFLMGWMNFNGQEDAEAYLFPIDTRIDYSRETASYERTAVIVITVIAAGIAVIAILILHRRKR
jgi:hypothetical protein